MFMGTNWPVCHCFKIQKPITEVNIFFWHAQCMQMYVIE